MKRQRSLLVNLPVEVLAQVISHVPAHARLTLSETCWIMYRFCSLVNKDTKLCRKEYLEYIASHTRDSLDHWVCWWCLKPHRYDYYSLPSAPWTNLACKEMWKSAMRRGNPHDRRNFDFSHPRMQFALKYVRLNGGGRVNCLAGLRRCMSSLLRRQQDQTSIRRHRYFTTIMKGHEKSLSVFPPSPVHPATYMSVPRIVDGRFLFKSTWSYPVEQHTQILHHLDICKHQGYSRGPQWDFDMTCQLAVPLYLGKGSIDRIQCHALSVCERFNNATDPKTRQNKLPLLIGEAILQRHSDKFCFGSKSDRNAHGDDFFGFCDACRAEFVVKISAKGSKDMITVTAWQDLGGECAPFDPECGPENIPGATRHIPGTVRSLFERDAESGRRWKSHSAGIGKAGIF